MGLNRVSAAWATNHSRSNDGILIAPSCVFGWLQYILRNYDVDEKMHPIRIRLAFRILVKRGDLIKDGDGDTARYKYDGVWLIQGRWVA